MKAKDITPGTVWAQERCKWSSPEPVVVLASLDGGHLFTSRGGRDGPYWHKATTMAARPARGYGYSGRDTGWAAARIGYANANCTLTYEERVELLGTLTLEDFLAAESPSDPERGIEFFLMLSARNITGTYAERTAAHEQDRRDRAAARKAAEQARAAHRQREEFITRRFAGHGVTLGHPDHVSLDTLEEILAKLDSLTRDKEPRP